MRIIVSLLLPFFMISLGLTQAAPAAPAAGSVSMTSILPDLDQLQAAGTQINRDLGLIRIDKWKVDSNSKQQAQTNADSVRRNLTTALPGLIDNVRSAPQDLTAEFKLYRNLNALYDVLASLTESTGAFGAKNDYEALAQQLGVIDSVRHNLGNALEGLTASTQSEVNQLRTQVHTLQQAAAAPPPPPKRVVVDDTEPVKKTTHKKKTAKSAAGGATPNSGSSSPPSGTANSTKQ